MARSSGRKDSTGVRPSATSPPQQFPGIPVSSCAVPSPSAHFYPGAPTSSSVNPSTPPHFYPGAPTSSSNHCMNQWRPLYTPTPEGLLGFGQIPPMPMYNLQAPPMQHHEQGNQRMENLHFVGISTHDSFSTPPPPPQPKAASRFAPAKVSSSSSKRRRKNVNNVDADESNERTAQRLSYTAEEHVRLANAWLECSTDPIDGNGKNGEKFWDDIATLYNSTTPSNRKRDHNQLKQEWQRTKKRLSAFHGEWTAVNGVYHSGFTTVDLETMAQEKYEAKYGHSFQHFTMWVKLRDEGKWLACYNRMATKGGKSPPNVINLEDEQRPLAGRDKAKAERAGKGKAREVSQDLGQKLEKFIEVNNQSMEERQKVMETQVFLSNRQLETAKITNKTKMLDVYQNLLLANTSRMDEAAKAGRDKALKNMESKLFSEGDQGE